MTTNTPLTRTMQPIIEAIGYDGALALVRYCGGCRVHLPKVIRANHLLVEYMGQELADALHRAIGPGTLEVPRCTTWLVARRNEEIEARNDGGESIDRLARRFGMTRRHIFRILREARHDGVLPIPTLEDFT